MRLEETTSILQLTKEKNRRYYRDSLGRMDEVRLGMSEK